MVLTLHNNHLSRPKTTLARNRYSRVVARFLMQARQVIENGALSRVGIADKGDADRALWR